ncbi:superoxide dismutase family protein [Nocardioides panzhihuensis]|uniref:Superoxide dismutase [Cu-Zn] n=1 Tax=Nocardioides panzhihuensis TaxID=860243 RepID=A0A7Z0DQX3_9ACTN|nr:superoxide dismutase family protein [Nocardioides panzhihuensis]NYI79995.1 Cu-Zn family superoxide dismutase [Nocardioides panzhihuensis]
MSRRATAATLAACGLLTLAACGEGADSGSNDRNEVSAKFIDPDGKKVGTVEIEEDDGATQVNVRVSGLSAGYHGFHVHTTGKCEADSAAPDDPSKTGDFLSAGGHLNPDDSAHGEHLGDLPSLLVNEDGTADLEFTGPFTLDDLRDADGSAVMIHAGSDNYANVPERYAPEGPDEDTTKTGDAGDRIACGVIDAG